MEIFVHRTRSSRARPDPVRSHHNVAQPRVRVPSATRSLTVDGVESGGDDGSIKDLRARRVFSPVYISVEHSLEQLEKIKHSDDLMGGVDQLEESNGIGVHECLKGVGSAEGSDDDLRQRTPPDCLNAAEIGKESTDRATEDFLNDHGAVPSMEIDWESSGSGVDEVLNKAGGSDDDLIQCRPPNDLHATAFENGSLDRGLEDALNDHGAVRRIEMIDLPTNGLSKQADGLNAAEIEKDSSDQLMEDLLNENSAAPRLTSSNLHKIESSKNQMDGIEYLEKERNAEEPNEVLNGLVGLVNDLKQSIPTDVLYAIEIDKESLHQTMEYLCNNHGALPSTNLHEIKLDNDLMDGIEQLERERFDEGNGSIVGEVKGSEGAFDDLIQSTPPNDINAIEIEKENRRRTKEDSPTDHGAAQCMNSSNRPKGTLDQGLTRCSRSRLFHNPNSFGYRRMLPFLMDLAKDKSNTVQIFPCHNSSIKVEKVFEESLKLLHVDPSPKQQLFLGGMHDSLAEKSTSLNPAVSLTYESSKCLNLLEVPAASTSEGNILDHAVPMPNPASEGELKFHDIKSETSLQNQILDPEVLCMLPQYNPVIREALSVEELTGGMPALFEFPVKPDPSCDMAVTKQKPSSGASKLTPLRSAQRLALSPRKGILKRQASGCKGICMCLDCASFRIHADRAFEFSRKQMLDADEIILDLVKELAGLRSLVEKSASSSSDGVSSPLPQFNQELVKGACFRASRAEQIANNRVRKMFNDLNMHCKIPGPRVTFKESLEERIP